MCRAVKREETVDTEKMEKKRKNMFEEQQQDNTHFIFTLNNVM